MLSLISKVISFPFVKTVTVYETSNRVSVLPEFTMSNSLQAAESYFPVTYKTNLLEHFFQIGSAIWIVITISAIIAASILYFLAMSELKVATRIRDNIYESNAISTPTVCGMIRPKIVLPAGVDFEHIDHILTHEKIHMKRRDNIWRMLAIIIACIHWFNPLIWLFLKSFLEDCELACDERAIKNMNQEERKNYARTLLAFGTENKVIFTSAFGSSKVKVRIKSILSYKRLTLLSSITFAGMLLVILFILLTNAEA
jgi:beta-lactamase regulating signal transducer with metallopeptidase domain